MMFAYLIPRIKSASILPKIITCTGPESTGKSTLCEQLAAHFGEPWVPEYARKFLSNIGRDYIESDLLEIAIGQNRLIQAALADAKEYLFVDTDAWTIYIWSKVKYGRVDPLITDLARNQASAQYLLCGTDVPWTYDPLRENPHNRDMLYLLYEQLLKAEQLPYVEVVGDAATRLEQVKQSLSAGTSLEI